ncbi:hypothetical protein B296_00036846 [Ensete ventricosum]|uniref:Uncharacterized protein n=1 Tax=Ensete ventricosum TaxID=4639 RepID=A0A427A192_ENSVE|nr:hypothetical protein B296_00036846 [Ensete ventricosum]
MNDASKCSKKNGDWGAHDTVSTQCSSERHCSRSSGWKRRLVAVGSATELTFFTSLDRENLNIAHVLWRYRVGYAAVSDSVFSLGS